MTTLVNLLILGFLSVSINIGEVSTQCAQHYYFWMGFCYPCQFDCGEGGTCYGSVCQCYPGYSYVPTFQKCIPICEGGCKKDHVCIQPNVCALYGAKESVEEEEEIPVEVTPTCRSACVNAKCTGLDECTCHRGYKKVSKFQCGAKCPQGCENGRCVAPGQCECAEGYRLEDENCVPECPESCSNGKCYAPMECVCNSGYERDDDTSQCEPVCDQPCQNGHCIGPNSCQCLPGYKKAFNNRFQCEEETVEPGSLPVKPDTYDYDDVGERLL